MSFKRNASKGFMPGNLEGVRLAVNESGKHPIQSHTTFQREHRRGHDEPGRPWYPSRVSIPVRSLNSNFSDIILAPRDRYIGSSQRHSVMDALDGHKTRISDDRHSDPDRKVEISITDKATLPFTTEASGLGS